MSDAPTDMCRCDHLRREHSPHSTACSNCGCTEFQLADPRNIRCRSFSEGGLRCQKWAPHEGVHTCTSSQGNTVDHWTQPELGVEDVGERTAMKASKLMMELIDLEFVADMAGQLQAGLVGERVPEGWRDLDPAVWLPKYRGAILRHLRYASMEPNAKDPETGASHWAGIAVNAMICWGLERIAAKGRIIEAAMDFDGPGTPCRCGRKLTLGACLFCNSAAAVAEGVIADGVDAATGTALDAIGEAAGHPRYLEGGLEPDATYRERLQAAAAVNGAAGGHGQRKRRPPT